MSSSNILLILISGFGVIHGLFLAIFLWVYKKGDVLSNKILSVLLIVLSFRIGKSVFLEFSEGLGIRMIFIGLATLMAIGPLFYLYTLALTNDFFKLKKSHYLHFIPTIFGLLFGFWINETNMEGIPKWVFVVIFLSYYLHYLGYLLGAYVLIQKGWKGNLDDNSYSLLKLLFYSLLIIWLAYFLNLFDEIIPYITGPILYTLVAYTVSFVVIKKGYLESIKKRKYMTNSASDEEIDRIFLAVKKLVADDKEFRNSNISLKGLSYQLNTTTQTLSMVINKKTGANFNNFINTLRIEEAICLFKNVEYNNHTIASIAYDIGFNSISSFNAAFKKQTGMTPNAHRKNLIK